MLARLPICSAHCVAALQVGRRVLVQQVDEDDDAWRAGKVTSYSKKHRKHTVEYDSGATEMVRTRRVMHALACHLLHARLHRLACRGMAMLLPATCCCLPFADCRPSSPRPLQVSLARAKYPWKYDEGGAADNKKKKTKKKK